MSAGASLPPPPPQHNPPLPSQGGIPNGNNNRERVFAHIQDLQAQASKGYNASSSTKVLIDIAEQALAQANAFLTGRRPDLAFVEFTRAFELATDVIPRHVGYIDLVHDDKNGEQRLKVLSRKLFAAHDQFMGIKGIIEKNNQRNGVLPQGITNSNGVDKAATVRNPGPALPPKQKPPPSPKPHALHGQAIAKPGADQAATDALMNRFSQLRMSKDISSGTASVRSSMSSLQSVPTGSYRTDMSSSDSMSPISMLDSARQTNGVPTPIRPAKLPIDTGIRLPKPPSPTYSPARNMDTNGDVAAPRYSARSMATSDARRYSLATPYSATPNKTPQEGEDYFPSPPQTGAILGSTSSRRRTPHDVDDLRISAERLYDYLKLYYILLIDVRTRDEFNQGHIFHRNIMCIEPMSLRQGMSAEQLQETLIISPEAEHCMWDDRDKFDLIVYYDQETHSDIVTTQASSEEELRLKYLHEALQEFNQEKPLRAAPKLLAGGLDAWCDVVGSQSLAVSNTQPRGQRPAGQVQRRPVPERVDSVNPRRRLRDYNPLDKEEEQRWMERARQESISAARPPIIHDETQERELINEPETPGNAAIEEFLQRFPDAGMIDQQPNFMSAQRPSRMPPPPPAKIPEYPPPPPRSSHPQVPSRPQPAAPRMSYNGVSDRAAPSLTRSTTMVPYIPPKYLATNLRLPRTGLVNFGVTCYMNATLQALSATTPLSIFFMDNDFKKEVQRDNWKGSKGVMPELYSTVVRSLWAGDVESIKPTTFRMFCGRLNREWSIDRQQDAKEFFELE